MRLFVAIEIPEAWRQATRDLRRELEARLGDESARALRWVQPDLVHLTLRFLGEFPDAAVGRLESALERHVGAIDLRLLSGELGWFGSGRRPRVVWLGADGDLDGLRALARRVDMACAAAGALPEARPFTPHVTVARVRERTSPEIAREIVSAVEAMPTPAPSALEVRRVALVRSHLGAGPPRYEVHSWHPSDESLR